MDRTTGRGLIGTGRQIETRGHVIGFREEIRRTAEASPNAFFTWFDDASGPDEAFVRGAWDFSLHIALPLADYLRSPETKTVSRSDMALAGFWRRRRDISAMPSASTCTIATISSKVS